MYVPIHGYQSPCTLDGDQAGIKLHLGAHDDNEHLQICDARSRKAFLSDGAFRERSSLASKGGQEFT